jgi:hypothetical protein
VAQAAVVTLGLVAQVGQRLPQRRYLAKGMASALSQLLLRV